MAQWLRGTVLVEDLSVIPVPISGSLQLLTAPAPAPEIQSGPEIRGAEGGEQLFHRLLGHSCQCREQGECGGMDQFPEPAGDCPQEF